MDLAVSFRSYSNAISNWNFHLSNIQLHWEILPWWIDCNHPDNYFQHFHRKIDDGLLI